MKTIDIRRSVRQFKDKEVSKEKIEALCLRTTITARGMRLSRLSVGGPPANLSRGPGSTPKMAPRGRGGYPRGGRPRAGLP